MRLKRERLSAEAAALGGQQVVHYLVKNGTVCVRAHANETEREVSGSTRQEKKGRKCGGPVMRPAVKYSCH